MPAPSSPSNLVANRLLSALPPAEYARLQPHLERVQLDRGRALYHAGDAVRHAYFLTGGMASLLSTTERGETIEVAIVGSEGLAGLAAVLGTHETPYGCVVQLPAEALRVRADVLRAEFDRGGRLRELLLSYTHALLCQIGQSAVCNRFHTTEQRLCRWLLVSHDRARSDTVELTQEFLSQMLGAPRTGVTAAAVPLQDAGLIRYRRGRITILNRQRLEAAACECYRIIRRDLGRLLAA